MSRTEHPGIEDKLYIKYLFRFFQKYVVKIFVSDLSVMMSSWMVHRFFCMYVCMYVFVLCLAPGPGLYELRHLVNYILNLCIYDFVCVEFPTWGWCCWGVGACFSSPSSSLSLCVCLASLPVIPSPYAHPAFSVALLTRRPCVSVSETHLLSSQHSEACCPICLPLSISTFIVVVTSVGHTNYYRSKGGGWVTQGDKESALRGCQGPTLKSHEARCYSCCLM